jgi:hypothetical protein
MQDYPDVFRQGGEYTQKAEAATLAEISEHFIRQGRRIGINSRIDLDFKRRQVRAAYSIVEGPAGPGPGDVKSFTVDSTCLRRIAVLDYRDADDYVPMRLVYRLVRTQPGSCLETSDLPGDIEHLRSTGLFSDVSFDISDSSERPQVSISIKGRPLRISSLSVKCYGQTHVDCSSISNALGLRVGDTYFRSKDRSAKKRIRQLLKTKHSELWIFEDLKPSDKGLDVSYGVILYRHSSGLLRTSFVHGSSVV